MKYGVVADLHCHAWSLFSKMNGSGTNSRLQIILEELRRCATEIKAQGGCTMIIAGDIMHARGSIDPEVLNPLRDVIAEILADGIEIYAIPGNHDLKSSDTKRLSSSVENLAQVTIEGSQLRMINTAALIGTPHMSLGFVPWHDTHEGLLKDLEELAKSPFKHKTDVFIHAGIDGVLSGMPGSGLTADMLAAFGFRNVFAGHYHNHKDMGKGVFSIGATAHHNWGDVDSRAGFLIVDGLTGDVVFHDTMAPKFVDISGLDEMDMELEARGNYARFRGPAMTQDEVSDFRKELISWGALGVSIEVPRTTVSARTTPVSSGMTLDQSIEAYVAASEVPVGIDKAAVQRRALEVLNESRMITESA